jgi:hypothetical protein
MDFAFPHSPIQTIIMADNNGAYRHLGTEHLGMALGTTFGNGNSITFKFKVSSAAEINTIHPIKFYWYI